MKRVYISYSKQDSEAALYLSTQLRGRGMDVYVNYDRLMNGGTFTRRSANEIKARDAIVFILSPEAIASDTVRTELRYAHDRDIKIVPVVIRPVASIADVPFLSECPPIDFTIQPLKQSGDVIDAVEARLNNQGQEAISVETAGWVTEVMTLTGHTSWVRSVAFSPDGSLLASASNDNTLRIWDTRGGDFHKTDPHLLCRIDGHDASAWDVSFAPRGGLLASCANDNTVRLWDMQSLPEPYEFARLADHHNAVHALAFSNDGTLLASASSDNSVHVRHIKYIRATGRADEIVPLLHAAQVYSVAFSPDGRLLASASRDSGVRVWDVNADNLLELGRTKPRFLRGHNSWVNAVTFSPNGVLLASAGHDEVIKLWDTNTLEEVGALYGHRASVSTVVFSPDGRVLASTSKDNTIRLWDVARGTELNCMTGHEGWVNSVAFSPDGRWLATASGDNTIKLWGMDVHAGQGV